MSRYFNVFLKLITRYTFRMLLAAVSRAVLRPPSRPTEFFLTDALIAYHREDGSIYFKKFFTQGNKLKGKKQVFILLVPTTANNILKVYRVMSLRKTLKY